MKALVKAYDKPGLWLQDMPKPEPGPEDVLIKINEVAICGTDLHIYNWDQWAQEHVPVPMTVGHEYIGIIEEIGELVHSAEVGDRVSGEGHIMCGECRNCRAGRGHLCRDTRGVGVNRPGAFAEYVCIPAQNAYKIPEQISDDIASILDPLGNAVHTALSFDLVGEDVLITGAGPIGLMATAVARHVGARHVVITDVNEKRLSMADQFGDEHGLAWFERNGVMSWPKKVEEVFWKPFVHARAPLYNEWLKRSGEQVERIAREKGMGGIDTSGFLPLPDWRP